MHMIKLGDSIDKLYFPQIALIGGLLAASSDAGIRKGQEKEIELNASAMHDGVIHSKRLVF